MYGALQLEFTLFKSLNVFIYCLRSSFVYLSFLLLSIFSINLL